MSGFGAPVPGTQARQVGVVRMTGPGDPLCWAARPQVSLRRHRRLTSIKPGKGLCDHRCKQELKCRNDQYAAEDPEEPVPAV